MSTAAKQSAASNWNVPNALTALRIALVPAYGFALVADGGRSATWRWVAAAIFAAAVVTDRLDGDIARRKDLITDFGKLADPIADKALMSMAFIGLSSIGSIWWWVSAVVLVREWGVTALRLWVRRYAVLPADRGGKLKTILQSVGLLMLTVPAWTVPGPQLWQAVGAVTLAIAVAVTIITGASIAWRAWTLRALSKGRQSVENLIGLLRERSLTVATAESLTGGLVSAALTSVPGSSQVVLGGVVSYATGVKSAALGVSPALLARGGPVQDEVAREMAIGVCRALDSAVGVATTGVAGPQEHDGVPVGTVFIAVAIRSAAGEIELLQSRQLTLAGERADIRTDTVAAAIALTQSTVAAYSAATP